MAKNWIERHPILTGVIAGAGVGSVVPGIGNIAGAIVGGIAGSFVPVEPDPPTVVVVKQAEGAVEQAKQTVKEKTDQAEQELQDVAENIKKAFSKEDE